MRKAFLVVLALAVPGLLLAQEAPPAQPAPAPKLGHPLDPADVAILTGKTRAAAPAAYSLYVMPYGYYTYPVNAPLFGQPLFAPVSTATQPPFVPLAFGRVSGRPFVVIRNTSTAPISPPFFFALGGSRGRPTVIVGPGFTLWRR